MCLETFAAWGLYVVAIVTVVNGIAMTSVGAALAAGLADYGDAILTYLVGDYLDGDTYQAAVYMLTILGPLLFLSAGLGCWGACRRKAFWLLLFNIITGVILIIVLVCGILASVYSSSFDKQGIENQFTEQLKNVYSNGADSHVTDVTNAWDTMQHKLVCCGVNDYSDWAEEHSAFYNDTGNAVPESCCVKYDGSSMDNADYIDCKDQATSNTAPDLNILNTDGCVIKLEEDVQLTTDVIMGTCFSLGLLNLVGVLVGCFLRGKLEGDGE